MKKLLNVMLVLLMCISLVACSNDAGNSDSDNNTNKDHTTDVDKDNGNTNESDTYEITDLKVNDKVVKVSYDPEELKLGTIGVSDTSKRFSGVNETFVMTLTPFRYDTVETYVSDRVNGMLENGNYLNVKASEISEDTFGTTKVKMFTINYDSKIYQNMDKGKEYTQAELDQLPYELEANTSTYYVLVLEDGTMIDLLVASGEPKVKQMFEYITFE